MGAIDRVDFASIGILLDITGDYGLLDVTQRWASDDGLHRQSWIPNICMDFGLLIVNTLEPTQHASEIFARTPWNPNRAERKYE